MTKLRTLNEIEKNYCPLDDDFCRDLTNPSTNDEDLKREAIKWIKELRKINNRKDAEKFFKDNEFYEAFDFGKFTLTDKSLFWAVKNIEVFILHFFNITEEDLK